MIFFSLLPMIITPLVGSLILYWMIDARGVVGATLITLRADPDLSLKASPPDLDRAVLLWRLDQRAVLVRRLLCRSADGPGDTLESR